MGFSAVTVAIAAIGTISSVISSIQQADNSKKVAQTNATNTEEAYALNAAENQRQLAKTLGTQRALFGASGVDSNVGSPFAIGESTAGTAGADLYNKRFEATKTENNQIAAGQQQANTAYDNAAGSIFKFGSNPNNISTIGSLFSSSSPSYSAGPGAGAYPDGALAPGQIFGQ